MKALILAAGIGKRLKLKTPKILLKIGNKTLLERHYENMLFCSQYFDLRIIIKLVVLTVQLS